MSSRGITVRVEEQPEWVLRAALEPLEARALLSVVPTGPEFQVNSYTPDDQEFPAVAVNADGDAVVVWESHGQDGDGFGIYGQRYNAAGVPLGGEFRANNTTIEQQYGPSVGMDSAGNFVVAWSSYNQEGDRSGYGVFAQRFAADGSRIGGEFLVNTVTLNNQIEPSVAVDADGDFVIAWASDGADGSSWAVSARRFDAAGVPLGAEFLVNQTTAGVQAFPAVATDAAGSFVVTWHSAEQDSPEEWDVYARRYSATGAPLGNEFRVNTETDSIQAYPSIDLNAAGAFVIAWRSDDQDGSQSGVYAQRYSSAGVQQGGEFRVNTTTAGDQSEPSVAVENDGDFFVAWHSQDQDGSGLAVIARQFGSSGTPLGGEVRVNEYTDGDQGYPAVAVDAEGEYLVAWDSEERDGDGFGIAARRLALPDTTAPTADIVDVTPDPRTTPVDEITIVFSEPVTGFDLSDLVLVRDTGPNRLTSQQTLTTTDGRTYVLGNLGPVTDDAADYVLFLDAETSGIRDAAGNALAGDAIEEWHRDAVVTNREIFYNNSAFDGNNPAASAADDNAIATDKEALRPGERGSFQNYTSYNRGINGVMVDIDGLPDDLTAADFAFRVGNVSNPATWAPAPTPSSITVREGDGAGGTDRVTITWSDNSIRNTWLQVSVLPTANTGLARSDVFYFGNIPGETGDDRAFATVSSEDYVRTRRNASPTADVTNDYDHNRDGRVSPLDVGVVYGNFGATLILIRPPGEGTGGTTDSLDGLDETSLL